MNHQSELQKPSRKLLTLPKASSHIIFLCLIVAQIAFFMVVDYLNIESIGVFNEKFYFDLTWEGRMYLLFFVWLFFLESIINWEQVELVQRQRSLMRTVLGYSFLFLPTIYILAVNFCGLGSIVVQSNQFPKLSIDYWALSLEYLVFSLSALVAVWISYGLNGIKTFPVSLFFALGITAVYTINGFYPFGAFKPLQLLSLPTSACTTSLLEMLGYRVELFYRPGYPGGDYGTLPGIAIIPGMKHYAFVAWPCAGVHSLLLYGLVMLLFLKKTEFSVAKKWLLFLFGAAVTYFLNVLRIASYCIIAAQDEAAARTFHDVYGEFYFMTWIIVYLLLIVAMQSGRKFPSLNSLRSKLIRI